ncbi:hypothetical protein EBS02_04920, partial [bacterium]|nr:hypothetical protein [bacterium]
MPRKTSTGLRKPLTPEAKAKIAAAVRKAMAGPSPAPTITPANSFKTFQPIVLREVKLDSQVLKPLP